MGGNSGWRRSKAGLRGLTCGMQGESGRESERTGVGLERAKKQMLIDVWNNYISPTKVPVFKNTRNTGVAVMPATAFTVPVITSPIVYV